MINSIPVPEVPEKRSVLENGIILSKIMYEKLNGSGFYPALTGGLLYKDGLRKDIDIVIFRNRQSVDHFEIQEIQHLLEDCGLYDFKHYGFVTKAKWRGFSVDLFNPETALVWSDGDY